MYYETRFRQRSRWRRCRWQRALARAMIDSKVKGVQLGAQSYSFRDRPHG